MKIIKTKFKGLIIIQNKRFDDNRGFFRELLIEKKIKENFCFHVVSVSKKNVIRGLHYQTKKPQGKFISVLKGKIIDIAVDLRKNSKTFGKHFKIILSDKNGKSIFIPSGFLHGFLALQKENIVHYYNTNYRSPKHETGVIWNDKTLKIKWPIKKPILSKKDKRNLKFEELTKKLR